MRFAWFVVVSLALVPSLAIAQSEQAIDSTSVKMWIPAVGQREDGSFFGVASSMEVTMQSPGSGRVFLSTQPLTQIDMQGSARLAVDTAAAVTGRDATNADFFFSVKTPSVTIGGPSAGGAMAVAVAALLEGWTVREDVVMTGMINPDGSIGPIGGVLQKLEAASSVDAKRFLIPLGQSTVPVTYQDQDPRTGAVVEREGTIDAKEYGKDEYDIEVEEVADLYDAVAPFTGFRLVKPEPTTNPLQGVRYGGITSRLADNLTEQVAQRLDSVSARYDAVRSEASASERTAIEQQLALATDRTGSARAAQNESKQYLASSLAFQGLVALGYVEALVGFFEGDADIASYTSTYIAATDSTIEDVAGDITVTYPIASSQLDSQAGAEQRLLESRSLQEDAKSLAENVEFANALQASSFARERAESARWWWKIGAEVAVTSPQPTLDQASVTALYARYQETAELTLAYAALIASQTPQFAAAQQAQQRSLVAAQEGMYPAAILELVQALAQTSTALVALGGEEPVRQRLDDLSSSAAYQIELAEAQGSPPVYAIALLELANSRTEAPSEAYFGYSTARLMARVSLQAAGILAPEPGVEAVRERNGFQIDELVSPNVVALVMAMGVGAILLLIAWGMGARTRQEPPRRVTRPPTETFLPLQDEPVEASSQDLPTGPSPETLPPEPPPAWAPEPTPPIVVPEPEPPASSETSVPPTTEPAIDAHDEGAHAPAAPKPKRPRAAPARKKPATTATRKRKPSTKE